MIPPTLRVIPRLDIKGPNVVKGVHLEGLRVLGKPEQFAHFYYEQGVDELLYMDVVASLYGRNSLLEIIERTAAGIAIPLTVGGGIRTLDDIRRVLRAGADKVSLNTAVVRNPDFVRQAANEFGSSTVLVSIEVMRRPDGRYEAFVDNGREPTGRDALEWAHQAVSLGAGEIMITSINREGTGKGFDLDITRQVADSVGIPVIACGGAGCADDVAEVVLEGHADAACLASILHYDFVRRHEIDNDYTTEGNIEYLRTRVCPSHISPASLDGIRERLRAAGIDCRLTAPPLDLRS